MRRVVGYMGGQAGWIALSMSAKLLAAVGELLIPFVLEHIIDRVAPGGSMGTAALWGLVMVLLALAVRQCNLFANRTAVSVSSSCTRSCAPCPSRGPRRTGLACPPLSPG